jgi:hypothetical protein
LGSRRGAWRLAGSPPRLDGSPPITVATVPALGSKPATSTRSIFFLISFSMAATASMSSGAIREIASPVSPARPVRPMRCT